MNAEARALHRRRVWGKVGRYALLTVLAVIVLFPIYITVVNSLLSPQKIISKPPTLASLRERLAQMLDRGRAG